MAKQGRCNFCEVRYEWQRDYPLRFTACTRCGRTLVRTTHILKKWPTRTLDEEPARTIATARRTR